jgi:hypothetical protein
MFDVCIKVSAKSRSLVQRNPTDCGVSKSDRGTSKNKSRPTSVVELSERKENAFAGILKSKMTYSYTAGNTSLLYRVSFVKLED